MQGITPWPTPSPVVHPARVGAGYPLGPLAGAYDDPYFELCTPAEIRDQVSSEETRGRPVLPGGHSWFWNLQTCLTDYQAGDTPHWDFCGGSLENVREKGYDNS